MPHKFGRVLRKGYYKPKASKVRQQPESSDDDDTSDDQASVEVGVQTDFLKLIEISTQTDLPAILTNDAEAQTDLPTIPINEAGTQTDEPADIIDAHTQTEEEANDHTGKSGCNIKNILCLLYFKCK